MPPLSGIMLLKRNKDHAYPVLVTATDVLNGMERYRDRQKSVTSVTYSERDQKA